jgi:hypothetical protein
MAHHPAVRAGGDPRWLRYPGHCLRRASNCARSGRRDLGFRSGVRRRTPGPHRRCACVGPCRRPLGPQADHHHLDCNLRLLCPADAACRLGVVADALSLPHRARPRWRHAQHHRAHGGILAEGKARHAGDPDVLRLPAWRRARRSDQRTADRGLWLAVGVHSRRRAAPAVAAVPVVRSAGIDPLPGRAPAELRNARRHHAAYRSRRDLSGRLPVGAR